MKDAIGLLAIIGLLCLLSWVYLNRTKYIQNHESQNILRILGSLLSGLVATFLLDGSLDLTIGGEDSALGFGITATGGIGVMVFVFWQWGKYNDKITQEYVDQSVNKGIEERIAQKMINTYIKKDDGNDEDSNFKSSTIQSAMQAVASLAKDKDRDAVQLLVKMDLLDTPSIDELKSFFESKSVENEVHANLAFITRDLNTAKHLAESVLSEDSENADMLMLKAHILERQGKDSEALNVLKKLLELQKKLDGKQYCKERADVLSFMAHLTKDKELAQSFKSESAKLYNKIGDTDSLVSVLLQCDDEETLAHGLGEYIEDTSTKAELLRHKASIDLKNNNREIALAGYRKALKIDEKLEELDGIYQDYAGISNVFLEAGDLHPAKDNAEKALESAKKAKCWKAVRANYIVLSDVAKEMSDISGMAAYLKKAEEISLLANDKEAADVISKMSENQAFWETGRRLGIIDENNKVPKDVAEFLFFSLKKYSAEESIDRLQPWRMRKILLDCMQEENRELTPKAAEELFFNLGFTSDQFDVDLIAWKEYQESMEKILKHTAPAKVSEMQKVRAEMVDAIDKAETSQEQYRIYAWTLRMGFDVEEPEVMDEKAYDAEKPAFLHSMLDDKDPMAIAINYWAIAHSVLDNKDSSEKEKNYAIGIFDMLKADSDPRNITIEQATRFYDKLQEALQHEN